jgi:ornithine--oxo-acid transaminase
VELFTAEGERILDFLSGYCVHNVGHNHPDVVRALQNELERCGPAMIQTHVADLAGELAEKLCARAGGRLAKVFFASSGSEGVEAAIKFARAHTRRAGILSAEHAFHGLTCGALSLMSDKFWSEGFGPLLADTAAVGFGDMAALERELKTKRFAAFIVEPIQSEAGVCVPHPDYLRTAESLCRRYGTLFVLDEVQTGMYRTGPFLAAHHFGVEPDMVVMAKAMSGGLVPCGAVLMSDAVCHSVYSSLPRAFVHTSTFSENSLAMRAALSTLAVLENEELGERSIEAGSYLQARLTDALRDFEMVKEVRGMGLLMGIEFKAPTSLRLRIPYQAFAAVHPAMFGQIVVMRLFRDSGFLTQICGNNFMVLKVAPPLVVTDEQLDAFVSAVRDVVELAHSPGAFWSEALGLARRAFRG